MSRSIARLWRARTKRAKRKAANGHARARERWGPPTVVATAAEPDRSAPHGEALVAAARSDAADGGRTLGARELPMAGVTYRRRERIDPCPVWKRMTDLVGASLALVILAPLFLLIAGLIKGVSRGPVFFRQTRYGVGGKPFRIWKFRTIRTSESPDQHQSHVINLMRSDRPFQKRDGELDMIPGGALLRKYGLDELPQLINVWKGDMSLVGPRPDVVPFESYEPWQRARFDVVPGITGLWQISGKNQTTFATMIELDIAYIRRRGVLLDVSIIAQTIPAMLLQ